MDAVTALGHAKAAQLAGWDWSRLARDGYLLGATAWVLLLAAGLAPFGTDAPIWHAAHLPDPYAHAEYIDGQPGFFYSPAFALAMAPFQALPLTWFVAGWSALLFAALYAIAGRWSIVALLFPPVALDIYTGNVHVLFAVVAVYGLRYPALWAFPLLTKVTPGIGLVWFLVRREWRNLAIALGATLAIVAVSFALTPTAWTDWIALLSANAGADVVYPHVPVPMLYRLPFAFALVAWGAWTDRRWTVPVAMLLALPVIWPGSFALLVAAYSGRR
jgi:hypothetical protein